MKKVLAIVLVGVLAASMLVGCGTKSSKDSNVIRVGASTTPHAEVLEVVKEALKQKGYELEIVQFDDYVLPNTSLESGELDANYFQHQQYLDNSNLKNNTHLVSIANIHYEPFGIYAGKTASLDQIKEGAKISVPNDPTNEARALLLLQQEGIITLKEGADINATKNDIAENPYKVEIVEMEAAQIARTLPDVDFGVLNGNYALKAGLNASEDALAIEAEDSIAATTYVNVLAVREKDKDREDLKALAEVLQSDVVKKFMEDTYKGAVVPVF